MDRPDAYAVRTIQRFLGIPFLGNPGLRALDSGMEIPEAHTKVLVQPMTNLGNSMKCEIEGCGREAVVHISDLTSQSSQKRLLCREHADREHGTKTQIGPESKLFDSSIKPIRLGHPPKRVSIKPNINLVVPAGATSSIELFFERYDAVMIHDGDRPTIVFVDESFSLDLAEKTKFLLSSDFSFGVASRYEIERVIRDKKQT